MEPQVRPLAALYNLNTDLLLNCLEGLSDQEAQRRLEAGGNSITFLAEHLTDSRHFLVARLGHTLRQSHCPLSRRRPEHGRHHRMAQPGGNSLRRGWE